MNNEEKKALQIDSVLLGKASISSPEDEPYVRMAKALETDAADAVKMDEQTATRQRNHLLQMAKNIKEQRAAEASQKTEAKKRNKIYWFMYFGVFATVCAMALIVFVSKSGQLPSSMFFSQNASQLGQATLSLIIPEAYAGDAFSMLVEGQKDGTAAADSSFRVLSKVPVSENDLKQSLRIVEAANASNNTTIAYNVKDEGNGSYLITPNQPLQEGSVYKLTIATAVQNNAGQTRPREFSWAIQTQDVFRVLQSVPGNTNTGVPLDTGIELTLSQTGWMDPKDYFSISPAVKGRFETHGRILAYVPDKPLSPLTLYTVTFKKGWGIKGGKTLKDDFVIKFETQSKEQMGMGESYFWLTEYEQNSALNQETVVYLNASDDEVNQEVQITGYALSMEDALSAIKDLNAIPIWSTDMQMRNKFIQRYAKKQAFNLKATIEQMDWQKLIRLPATLEKGWYAVKIEASKNQVAWMILQRTNAAAYAIADRNQILVWVVNSDTHKPLVHTDVTYNDKTYQTDEQGLVHLPTPSAWVEMANSKKWKTDLVPELLKIGSADLGLVFTVEYSTPFWSFGSGTSGSQSDLKYYSYIFPDRPLYRMSDKIQFFGLMQDRETHTGAGDMLLELRGDSWDFATYEEKVYARAELKTDESGFFNGELSWTGKIKPGNYQLVLVKNGSDATSRSIEIRDTAKPAYNISLQTDKKAVYAGDVVRGNVQVSFFDGTPFAKARVLLHAWSEGIEKNQEAITDDAGRAEFEFATDKPTCDLQVEYPYCGPYTTFQIEAAPLVGEEAEIKAYKTIKIWRSHANLESITQLENQEDESIVYRVREVNLDQNDQSDDNKVLGNGKSGVMVKAKIFEENWDKVQNGTTYDPIEKKLVPVYDYKMHRTEIGSHELVTDSEGQATLKFSMKDNTSYRVLAEIDTEGTQQTVMSYASRGASNPVNQNDQIVFEPENTQESSGNYKLGDIVSLSFMKNGEKISSDNATFLYIRASRGIKTSQVSGEATYRFDFGQEDMPNTNVYGVAFLPTGFVQKQYSAAYNTEDLELKIDVLTDKQSYAPGEQVNLTASIKDKDGNPVKGAHLAMSVTDEALLALAQGNYQEYPMQEIYRWVADGILTTKASNSAERMFEGGGAERGGGEAQVVRKNFKDQAVFIVVQTDKTGRATASFPAPDNITSWRVTAAAVSNDLHAGSGKADVKVTKPLFVDAVVPQNLLVSDKPTIKLRAFGSALPKTGNVDYTVDIPTLGINNQKVSSEVNKSVYVAVDKLLSGIHKATISVLAGGYTDAIEKNITVVDTRATHDERVITELAPGTVLPDAGVATEVDVTIESKARSALRSKVESLTHAWSARLESQLAKRMMQKVLVEDFKADTQIDEMSLAQYQQNTGGLAILPYASAEVGISAKAAAADAGEFDRIELANYFWTIIDDPKVSREESIEALSGLASLGEPVIDRLHTAEQQSDLSWRESLALARGLDAIGDREQTQVVLDALLSKTQENDGFMYLQVSDSPTDVIEATAEAAALAAEMAHPSAEKLMTYVDSMWNNAAMTDLDRAMYLQKVAPTLSMVDVQIIYAIGEKTQTLSLKDAPWTTIKLTPDELASFRVVSVNGPAAASFVKRLAGAGDAGSDLVSLERSYSVDGKPLAELHEGDTVKVSLMPHWNAKAPDGCYMVRDRLPATLIPLQNIIFDPYRNDTNSYPYDITQSEVSFVACKSDKAYPINYSARVVSLGSYTADGAFIQSMDTPSIAAMSKPVTMAVK